MPVVLSYYYNEERDEGREPGRITGIKKTHYMKRSANFILDIVGCFHYISYSMFVYVCLPPIPKYKLSAPV